MTGHRFQRTRQFDLLESLLWVCCFGKANRKEEYFTE
jgi:hypothetical protein